MKTLKLTLEGEPQAVEAIARRLREFLSITEEGKNQRLALRNAEQVRRVLRVAAPVVKQEDDREDAS